ELARAVMITEGTSQLEHLGQVFQVLPVVTLGEHIDLRQLDASWDRPLIKTVFAEVGEPGKRCDGPAHQARAVRTVGEAWIRCCDRAPIREEAVVLELEDVNLVAPNRHRS